MYFHGFSLSVAGVPLIQSVVGHSRYNVIAGVLFSVDDAELLESLLGGDESPSANCAALSPTLLKSRLLRRECASAEDVAQDTWIAVLKGVERFQGRSSFKTWLLRICANRARTSGVKEHDRFPSTLTNPVRRCRRTASTRRFWSEPPVPFTDAVETRLDNSALVDAVRHAIDTLGEPQQAVVTLRDVEGLSTQEVATLLGLSEANVR